MQIKTNYSLKALNTFGVDVCAHQYARLVHEEDIVAFLSRYPLAERRHLILGGGSNLLFVNNFQGIVLHPVLKGITVVQEFAEHVLIKAMAGEAWDDLVAFAVDRQDHFRTLPRRSPPVSGARLRRSGGHPAQPGNSCACRPL